MKYSLILMVAAALCGCFDEAAAPTRQRVPDSSEGEGGASGTVNPGPKRRSPDAGSGATVGGTIHEEPPIDLPETEPDAPVVLNEVSCRGTEFVEVVNRGSRAVDLSRFAIADHTRTSDAQRLSGMLAPGAYASFALDGLACDADAAVLFEDGVVVDHAAPPLMPATASYARVPDAEGDFTLAKPTPGKPNSAFIDDAARLFLELTDAVPDVLPELHITLPAATVASLRGVTADDPREWFEGTITFRDARGEVGPISTGLRLKGQSVFRDIDGKAAFRLDFDRYEENNYLFGLEKLTLNNFVQDASATHERMYYGLLAQQGCAAPRVGYVNVWVNDQPFGVYLALESSDEQAFLGRNFGTTASLYEGEYGADLYPNNSDGFDEDYGDDPDRTALKRVIEVLNAASDAGLMADTSDVLDWDRLIPQFAADLFTGHFDSYTANRNNFTFHIDDHGRLSVISGGADQAFDQTVERDTDGGQLLARCLRNGACTRELDAALERTAEGALDFLDSGGADGLRADAVRLYAAFDEDPRTEWDQRNLEQLVDTMIAFIERSARTR